MAHARISSADGDDPVSLLRQEVQKEFAKQANKDAAVVGAMDRFADLDKEEMEAYLALPEDSLPAGWTKRALRIALMARRSRAKAPFALVAAHERTMARIRRTDDAPSAMRLGIALVSIPARAERAEASHAVVIEATEVKG